MLQEMQYCPKKHGHRKASVERESDHQDIWRLESCKPSQLPHGLVSPENDNWTLTKNASVIKQEEQISRLFWKCLFGTMPFLCEAPCYLNYIVLVTTQS
jgi:hypothetical protein